MIVEKREIIPETQSSNSSEVAHGLILRVAEGLIVSYVIVMNDID